MGPVILFDKSFLQSLSIDESVWFDHFFSPNICPIFYVETLSDLKKNTKNRTPEDEVRIIAEKTPQKDGYPNIFHPEIYVAELLGNIITMNGRPVVRPGKIVQLDHKIANVSDLPPEMEAFLRWQDGEFYQVEKNFAQFWRDFIKSINLETISKGLDSLGVRLHKCKSLEDAKSLTDSIVNGRDNIFNRLKLIFTVLAIPPEYFQTVFTTWASKNVPPLIIFAPYTAHVLTIEIFFYIAANSNLISTEKVSNRVDLAYLFYSPFCNIFASSDKLHKRCAPLFLRDDQLFIWGPDLKADLKKLDEYHDKLPIAEKEKGLYEIAPYPPLDNSFLIRRVWDELLASKREKREFRDNKKERKEPKDNVSTDTMIAHINKLVDTAKSLDEDKTAAYVTNPDEFVITRKIRKKKGKWWQVPKNLETQDDNI